MARTDCPWQPEHGASGELVIRRGTAGWFRFRWPRFALLLCDRLFRINVMCHHYIAFKTGNIDPRWVDEFNIRTDLKQIATSPISGVYPLSHVPVIRPGNEGNRELVTCEWGLLPRWWKPTAKAPKRQGYQRHCFNARSETVADKPSFREAFKRRRCLMPASAFFERGHYFALNDDRPFAFAGLWERWGEGEEIVESCTLITTEPNAEVRSVGHDRMPVLLTSEDEYARWLDREVIEYERLEPLLRTFPDDQLNCYKAKK